MVIFGPQAEDVVLAENPLYDVGHCQVLDDVADDEKNQSGKAHAQENNDLIVGVIPYLYQGWNPKLENGSNDKNRKN